MSKRSYPFPYKTVANDLTLAVSSISIENISIQSPNTYPTYTLTLPPNDGSPGQILSTDGSGVLSWVNDSAGTGTVTSVSATVPAWLSVTVSNPTTTPAIAITGTSTGTGTVTVLQDSPTINTLLTVTGQVDITRNSGSGHAMKITNAHAGVQDNYIEIGKNSSNRNHAHFGHHFVSSGDSGNYAYMQTNNNLVKFFGTANFTFPATTGVNGQLLTTDGTGVTSWSNAVTSVNASSPITSTGGTTPTIGLTTVPVTLGGTGLTTLGTFGQVLTTNGINMLWDTLPTYVSSVSAGSLAPFLDLTVLNPTTTPQIGLSFTGTALPVANGGTGLTSVGTFGQVLTTNGINMLWDNLPASVTSVTASSPISSSGGSTPNITLSTVPTTLGGTGLTTVGTNGQVLTSNGTSLSWQTPITNPGTVTSVSGGSLAPFLDLTVLNPTTTPQIGISFTGTALPVANGGTGLTSVGTFGQVLTTNGINMLWDNLPASVTSVTASSPISSSGGSTPNITLSTVPTTLGGTGLTTVGTNGQVLASNGTSLQYVTLPSSVTSVTASSPLTSSGGATPNLTLSTVPTTLGGTGLTTVGTSGQVLTSNGTTLSWQTPTSGGVTSVTATSPIASSGGTTPNLSLSTVPTTLGGTGLTTVGTSGQVLTSNGTTLSWQTPSTSSGTVTSVSASVPAFLSVTVTNPTTTPDIAISGTSTGTGSVVLQTSPTINNLLSITNPSTTFFNSIESYAPNLGTSHSNAIRFGKSSTTGEHGFLRYLQQATAAASSISLGLGSTQIAINGSGQFTVPGGILASNSWNLSLDNLIVSGTTTTLSLSSTTAAQFDSITSYAANLGNNLFNFFRIGKNSSSGEHGFLGYTAGATLSAKQVQLGIGTNVIALNQNAQCFIAGATLTTTQWTIPTSTSITSGGVLSVNNNTLVSSNFNNLLVLAPNLQSGVGIQIRLGTAQTDNTGITFGWKTNTTTANRYAYFETASVERLVINTGGNIGIGTSTPAQPLDVVGKIRTRDSFTSNNVDFFTYASGTFTPRIAMFYTNDNKVYECNAAPTGRDNIAITYSVQAGYWVRVGNMIMVNMEVSYSQTYAGVFFSLDQLNIVCVIPEAICKVLQLVAVGMTGCPTRIADKFVDNYQLNYYISNPTYAPGGTICTAFLFRNNTHDALPWDPASKSGQRLNITTSYYVNQ